MTGSKSLGRSSPHTSRFTNYFFIVPVGSFQLLCKIPHSDSPQNWPNTSFSSSWLEVSSYLLAEAFLSECLSVLAGELSPSNCQSYLSLAQEICCPELKTTVFTYISRNLMEMPQLVKYATLFCVESMTWHFWIRGLFVFCNLSCFNLVSKKNCPCLRCLNKEEKEQVVQLRTQGDGCLCSLRKENLTSWNDPETERARYIFVLDGSEDSGEWCPVMELPFTVDKWCFTTVVLYNYLYIIGGYRQRVKRGWEFKMASFRFNPLTLTWVAIAPLIKVRQPFSLVSSKINNKIHTKVLFLFSPIVGFRKIGMQTVIVSCIHSTGGTSAQWPVMAVFMLWEAGTWTHWWLRTLTRPSIQP